MKALLQRKERPIQHEFSSKNRLHTLARHMDLTTTNKGPERSQSLWEQLGVSCYLNFNHPCCPGFMTAHPGQPLRSNEIAKDDRIVASRSLELYYSHSCAPEGYL